MPEEKKTAETEQERLADFPREFEAAASPICTASVKDIWMTVCAATAL